MKCAICGSENVTVHLTQIVNGKLYTLDLCEAHAKELGVTDLSVFSLKDLLINLGKHKEEEDSKKEVTCPHCGFTESDLERTGRLGCAHCYNTFADRLNETIEEAQQSTNHTGKIPSKLAKLHHYEERLNCLNSDLRAAVESEQFEEAASLRDQIAEIRSQISSD